MPEIEIVGKRRKGRDEIIDDAMKTMERFFDWLVASQERNPWLECDAVSTAMLYAMLTHLQSDIDKVLEQGGEEARNAYEFFSRGKNA